MLKKSSLAVAAALALVFAGGAQAATTNLGAATPGAPLAFGGFAPVGPFTDIFTFSLPANGGSGYSVTNFELLPGLFNVALTTMSLFSNPDGILFNADDTFLASSAAPGGNALALTWGASGAGDYYLNVTGISNGTQGGIYNGAISVSVVPEPATVLTLLAGLGVIGFVALRRRNDES